MKIVTALAILCSLFTSSIYTKTYTTLNGEQAAMAQHQGKRILLVNIASSSPYAATQLPQLEQLYKQYKDSLMVIAFPTNDFGKEPLTDAELKMLLENTYHINFPVSVKTGVKDSTSGIHAVYKWLQDKNENGLTDMSVQTDFMKYLIDKDGSIMGVFSAQTKPSDSSIVKALMQ